jgi:hypothetical protein
VLFAVRRIIELFCFGLYPGDVAATALQVAAGELFLRALYAEWKLADDADLASERVWTSQEKMRLVGAGGVAAVPPKEIEFCSIFSQAIRDDRASASRACAILARGLKTNLVGAPGARQGVYPVRLNVASQRLSHGKCWRGGGFDDQFQPFFTVGRKYRVPAFLATSVRQQSTNGFMDKAAAQGYPVVQWTFEFDLRGDPRGENLSAFRCKHANLLRVSHVEGEFEFLFQAYSVFTVKEVQWSTDTPATRAQPHRITLVPAVDNALEDEDSPLAPWF